jgi:hypothetical protein
LNGKARSCRIASRPAIEHIIPAHVGAIDVCAAGEAQGTVDFDHRLVLFVDLGVLVAPEFVAALSAGKAVLALHACTANFDEA